MTPKEKAQELIETFTHVYIDVTPRNDIRLIIHDKSFSIPVGQVLALLAVNQILETIYNKNFGGHLNDEIGAADYWTEVKSEINKVKGAIKLIEFE